MNKKNGVELHWRRPIVLGKQL